MPPTVIFDRKSLCQEFTIGEVPCTTYALSSSGWVNSEIFSSWFHDHFLAHAPPQRPLLLLLDGHSSHFEPGVVRTAAEKGVLIFCLPLHTTHLTQPLDKGYFAPLKMFWHEECQLLLSRNPGKVVTRYQFSELFGRAWMRGMTMTNIIAGFHTTGVYPFNWDALQLKVLSSSFDPTSHSTRTGLKFIPLYSPAAPRCRSKLPTSVNSHVDGSDSPTSFTVDEIKLFQRRYDEGYDLHHDERYNLWLKTFDPHLSPDTTPPAPSAPLELDLNKVDTLCVLGRCQHRDAVDWVQCEQCTGWVHCICSSVNCKLARSKSSFLYALL